MKTLVGQYLGADYPEMQGQYYESGVNYGRPQYEHEDLDVWIRWTSGSSVTPSWQVVVRLENGDLFTKAILYVIFSDFMLNSFTSQLCVTSNFPTTYEREK